MTDPAQRDAARYGPAALQMPHQAPPIIRTTAPAGAATNTSGIEASRGKAIWDGPKLPPWFDGGLLPQPFPIPIIPDDLLGD